MEPTMDSKMPPLLPVEVWCKILRSLDATSLLSASRASPQFLYIIQGDPILRIILETAIQHEKFHIEMKKTLLEVRSICEVYKRLYCHRHRHNSRCRRRKL